MPSDGTRYLHGLGLAAVEHAGAWYYPHTDALGSLRRWSDASGQVVGARDYDPYGAITQQQGVIPAPLGFAGEWHDRATGLQYLRPKLAHKFGARAGINRRRGGSRRRIPSRDCSPSRRRSIRISTR